MMHRLGKLTIENMEEFYQAAVKYERELGKKRYPDSCDFCGKRFSNRSIIVITPIRELVIHAAHWNKRKEKVI